MLKRLQQLGMLRRAETPAADVVAELFISAADRMQCDECDAMGLFASPAVEEDDDDWGDARTCKKCSKPIPAERLELFPNATYCVACQASADSGQAEHDVEYCPRCGSIMQMRQTRAGGISRYVIACEVC